MSDRFSRQQDLVPTARLQSVIATVIGVGAIGRQVALQLTALGIRQLRVIDFDRVESTNVTTQGYRHADIGLTKVTALGQAVHDIDPSIALTTIEDRFRPRHAGGDVVFCCVDSIATRAAIWRAIQGTARFWCDGRMLGEVIRVPAASHPHCWAHYAGTLFDEGEAQSGSCTARSTIYTANMAAGLMVHQFSRWLRNIPVEPDLTLNLLGSELVAA